MKFVDEKCDEYTARIDQLFDNMRTKRGNIQDLEEEIIPLFWIGNQLEESLRSPLMTSQDKLLVENTMKANIDEAVKKVDEQSKLHNELKQMKQEIQIVRNKRESLMDSSPALYAVELAEEASKALKASKQGKGGESGEERKGEEGKCEEGKGEEEEGKGEERGGGEEEGKEEYGPDVRHSMEKHLQQAVVEMSDWQFYLILFMGLLLCVWLSD